MNVTIQWNHDGSGPPVEFKVEGQVGAGAWTPVATVPYAAGTTTYSTIDAGGTHGKKYRVAAVNASGQAAWVESDVATLPPNPVTDVVATYTG